MKRATIRNVLLATALVCACGSASSPAGELRAWGLDHDMQVTNVPAGDNYTAIAAGDAHGLALKTDGRIVAWGQNDDGECDVPAGTYKAIGAGADFSLAIRTDGSIAAWGYDHQGQVSGVPAGYDFVAVDGGEFFGVALRADGSIVAWGSNRWGQVSNIPAGTGFKAVVAGDDHAVALRADGSLVAWGYWAAAEGAPTSGAYTAIGAGGSFSTALKSDGSLVWWGHDRHGVGLDRVPTGTGHVAVSAGYLHGLALRQDGSLVGWGAGTSVSSHPNWGQARPPAGNDYATIACGLYFSVALTGRTGPTSPTDPTNPTVVSDNFNDNDPGSLWKLHGDDLLNCWLESANQRVELITTSKAAQGVNAYYLANEWRIDPASDFAFKVAYHVGLTDKAGWVFLGVTPNVQNELYTGYVRLGAGCDGRYPFLWYEAIDGVQTKMDISDRTQDDGVLYISYRAALDELYVSGTGYGSQNAWAVIPRVLGASWRSEPLVVFLGGGADGMALKSGDIWLDNFAVDSGSVSAPPTVSLGEVYRFWSPITDRYFYTISQSERDWLISEHPQVWTYQGPAFKAATSAFLPGLKPVYRFWSETGQSHFFTISEADKNLLIEQYSHVWAFEDVAFYAYPEGAQPADSVPVYRFWKPADDSHFYTANVAEKDQLIRERADVYTFEGVAFYAYGL